MAQSYGLSDDISVSLLSRFPDVLLVEKEEEDAEQVAQDISAVMEQALSDLTGCAAGRARSYLMTS